MVSHRRDPRARTRRVARLGVLSAAATAAAAMGAVPVLAEPGAPPADSTEASRQMDVVFAEAERAVEAYNGAAERVAELTEEFERHRDRVADGQETVNEKRHGLGYVAAAQYRAGGLGPAVALMLSASPDTYLERATAIDRMGDRRAVELRELLAAQRSLEQRRQEAGDKLAQLTGEQERLERHKRTAQRKLALARRQYEELSERERRERERERERADRSAVREEPAAATPAAAPEEGGPASGRGATAVAAARGAVGRPYAWGQAGPDAFDCSGLTQWAYAQAGVALPRTSQGQAGAGRKVSLSEARPGDLVIYRADASHVGMYVGGGQIVHSPYPGAQVRYEAVGILPVSSVVRP
ncbi:NlpC/P60 family protein [Streptomyces sp. SBT349]|uniref:C40 family peptidase n=1 Tax=Streptomyces sp. SBT349 TaxID=1580539 RepID=UPI00066AD435|nr:C40 family peptidase [Streptomyces sp. SBT349]